jgi:hypothetical protein
MSFTLPGNELIQVVCPPFGDVGGDARGGDGGDGVYFGDEAFRNAWERHGITNIYL